MMHAGQAGEWRCFLLDESLQRSGVPNDPPPDGSVQMAARQLLVRETVPERQRSVASDPRQDRFIAPGLSYLPNWERDA